MSKYYNEIIMFKSNIKDFILGFIGIHLVLLGYDFTYYYFAAKKASFHFSHCLFY
jgi:hypothetical protein